MGTEAGKREQLASRVNAIDTRTKQVEQRVHEVHLLAESNKDRIDRLEAINGDLVQRIAELRKELNVWISSLKSKDYDGKIAAIHSEISLSKQ